MSRWLARADAIKAMLEGQVVISSTGLAVLVHRKKNLESELAIEFEKSATGCVVIAWLGGTNPERKRKPLVLSASYSISIWLPERPAGTPQEGLEELPDIDVIAEALADALHQWEDNSPGSKIIKMEVTDVSPIPDDNFQIVEIKAECPRV